MIDVRVRAHRGRPRARRRGRARAAIAELSPRDDVEGAARSRLLRLSARLAAADGDADRAAALAREAAEVPGATPFERALSLADLAAAMEGTGRGGVPRTAAASILTDLGVADIPRLLSHPLTSLPSEVPSP